MWDSITAMVNGDNGIFILCFIVLVIILIMMLSKSGFLSVHTSNFSLGGATREREIIRRQIETAHACVTEAIDALELNGDDYHVKYIFERIYDKVVEWIVFNHISNMQIYIDSKTAAVYNLIISLNPPENVKTPELKKKVADWVRQLVQQLIQTREYYSKQR